MRRLNAANGPKANRHSIHFEKAHMKTICWLVIAGAAIGFAGILGFHIGASSGLVDRAATHNTVRQFAESGVAAAQQGNFEMASFLLRRAINGMDADPSDCELVWQAIKLLPPEARSDPALMGIISDFFTGLDQSLRSCDSVEQFTQIYKLWSVTKKEVPAGTKGSSIGSRPNPDAMPSGDEPDPAKLFEEGIIAFHKKEMDRADFLTQAALRAQVQHASATQAVWNRFQAYLAETSTQPVERMNRLVVYRESVEAALQGCTNMSDFDRVWDVRESVVAEIGKVRGELLAEIKKRIETFQKNARVKKDVDLLVEFAGMRSELEPKLAILLATGAPNESDKASEPADAAVTNAAATVIDYVSANVDRLEKEQKLKSKETEAGEAINSAEAEKIGPCEKLLNDVGALNNALRQSQIDHWLIPSKKEDKEQVRLAQLGHTITTLYGAAAKLQQLRYNIWALQRISAAQSVDAWDDYLADIDTSLLHPSVNALYSSVYDLRIKQREDPLIRVQTVQKILAGKKTALQAF